MKKSLIALAVAATAATPMAASAAMLQASNPDQSGINLYGSFRPQIVNEGDLSFGDGVSRWGLMGSHDLGNGLEAVYRFERKMSTNDATQAEAGRLSYAGLKGGFGAVLMGQQWTPYYNVVAGPSDIFASTGIAQYSGPFRTGNALTYALPGGMPVGGAITFVVDGDGEEDDLDATSVGLTFGAGPVMIGLGVHDVAAINRTRVGLSLSGEVGGFGYAFMLEDTDPQEGDGGSTPWAVTGTFAGFALQYSDADAENVDSAAITLGYTYKLSGNTRIQLAWEDSDLKEDDKFVARYRVDF